MFPTNHAPIVLPILLLCRFATNAGVAGAPSAAHSWSPKCVRPIAANVPTFTAFDAATANALGGKFEPTTSVPGKRCEIKFRTCA